MRSLPGHGLGNPYTKESGILTDGTVARGQRETEGHRAGSVINLSQGASLLARSADGLGSRLTACYMVC